VNDEPFPTSGKLQITTLTNQSGIKVVEDAMSLGISHVSQLSPMGFSKKNRAFQSSGRLQRSQVVGTDFILTGPLGHVGERLAQYLYLMNPNDGLKLRG
jgi:hypothetical protein